MLIKKPASKERNTVSSTAMCIGQTGVIIVSRPEDAYRGAWVMRTKWGLVLLQDNHDLRAGETLTFVYNVELRDFHISEEED